MEAIRENLIENIHQLPMDIISEVNDFMEFLLVKKSVQDNSKEYILDSLNESAKEMKMVLEGRLQARNVDELLDEL